jgi:ProP effector
MGGMKIDREQVMRDREALVRTFPRCFMVRGQAKVPLKVGIRADLAAATVLDDAGEPLSAERKQAALMDYCWGPKYQKALLASLDRIDLDGKPEGKVEAEHKRFAAEKLKRIAMVQNQRRAEKKSA